MTRLVLVLATLAVTVAAGQDVASSAYVAEVDAWHAQRIERLRAEDGWLSLVGLHPLHDGVNTIGTDDDSDIRLDAAAPARVGRLVINAGHAVFTAAPGADVTVDNEPLAGPTAAVTDARGPATVFILGSVRFHVIDRAGLRFLRVADSQSPVRLKFQGIDRFPVDPTWRVTARLITEGQPTTVPSANVLGQVEQQPSPGVLEFEVAGRTLRLVPVGEPGQPLFIVFSDVTSGHQTYGGGRFLSAPAPGADGRVVLDFNRATNPPCAFTPHATCPVPPVANRLPVAVTAGERAWGAGH